MGKAIRYATEEERLRAQRESQRRYREANRQKIRDHANQFTAANRDRLNEQRRQERTLNPQKFRDRERRRRDANPDLGRNERLRKTHGLRPADWDAMWKAQEGRCYLCDDELSPDQKAVHVDHDHECCPRRKSCPLCRRGLACAKCNQLVGLAEDDPARLETIAAALRPARIAAADRIRIRAQLSPATLPFLTEEVS